MKWIITIKKATASAVNVAVVFTATAPVYYFLGIEWWRASCITLFMVYNLLLSRRCLGQRISRTFQNEPTNTVYAALYTASFATLLWWIWLPLDLALANGLLIQIPCLALRGNTLHGLLAGRRTMTENEYLLECIGLKGECPDCKRQTIVALNETHFWCKYCRAAFLVSGFHVTRAHH
jgi:hypothetical protein